MATNQIGNVLAILEDLQARPIVPSEFVTLGRVSYPAECTQEERKAVSQELCEQYQEAIASVEAAWGKPVFSGPYYELKFPIWFQASEATYWHRNGRLLYLMLDAPEWEWRGAFLGAFASPDTWLVNDRRWLSGRDLTLLEKRFLTNCCDFQPNIEKVLDTLLQQSHPSLSDSKRFELSQAVLKGCFEKGLFAAFEDTFTEERTGENVQHRSEDQAILLNPDVFLRDRQRYFANDPDQLEKRATEVVGKWKMQYVVKSIFGEYIERHLTRRDLEIDAPRRTLRIRQTAPARKPSAHVKLRLHGSYTFEETVAAFGDEVEYFCDRQFAVTPSSVLLLTTLGGDSQVSYASNPCGVCWKPRRLDYHPTEDHYPWFPSKVHEVWNADENSEKSLHVAARTVFDPCYVYLGEAQLSQMGHLTGEVPDKGAKFWLCNNMSREVWQRLGGYPDWLVTGPDGVRRMSKGDTAELLRLIEEHAPQYTSIEFDRYEQDRLRVRMNSERGWLLYDRPRGGQLRACDSSYSGPLRKIEYFGTDVDDIIRPAKHTVPRDAAIRAIIELLKTGELPKCVRWVRQKTRIWCA